MPGVIKGGFGGYVYNNSFDEEPVMKTIYGRRAQAEKKEEKKQGAPTDTAQNDKNDKNASGAQTGEPVVLDPEVLARTVSVEEARIEREKLQAEYEAMRSRYEKESEQFVLRARDKATEIYEETKAMAVKTVSDARAEAKKISEKAQTDAKELLDKSKTEGYDEGHKLGYDEGYVKALKKCKASLLELKELSEQVTAAKNDLLMKYERQLFDTIFEIAQKVTLGALGQKDKAVITRMIREAGKKYKASKNVRIILSKLDVSEESEIDEELLKEVFRNSENIDIELQDDAPQGTLMIDDGTELTDASVMTQLKMVEQLGKGKYRDTNLTDMLQTSGTQKPRRTAKKKTAKETDAEQLTVDDGDDEQAVPDVVYKKGRAAAAASDTD